MTRWDEQEKQRSQGISGLLFIVIFVFALGFVIGIFWGLSWYESANIIVPPVFGELATTTYHITLYDGISVGDSIHVTTG